MSSSGGSPLQTLWDAKEYILAGVGAVLATKKLYELSQDKHVVDQSKRRPAATDSGDSKSSSSSSTSSIDPTLFPQFMPSTSCPSLWLFYRQWEVSQPRCIVFLFHGYGEHIGRYEAIAARLNAIGASVYGFDQQGHGQSDGERVYVERLTHYVQDGLAFVEFIQKGRLAQYKNKPLPCFLHGHSMGGLIATQMMRASYTSALQPTPAILQSEDWPRRIWPWTGCILSSPALEPNPETASPFMIKLAGFFADSFPKMQLTGLDIDGLSRNRLVVAQYQEDRLNWHGNMRARWGHEMLVHMREVKADAGNITWPMLIIQGDSDRIVYPPGSTYFYEHVASKDKKIRVWKGAFHELLYEIQPVADQATQEICEWIQLKAQQSASTS